MTKLKQPVTVEHGQIIDGSFWYHQINHMIMNLRSASITLQSWDLPKEAADKLKIGYIIIHTKSNQLAGLIKDNANRFRLITFPADNSALACKNPLE